MNIPDEVINDRRVYQGLPRYLVFAKDVPIDGDYAVLVDPKTGEQFRVTNMQLLACGPRAAK